VEKLTSYRVPGVRWRAIHFKPYYGKSQGKLLHGVQYSYKDYSKAYITLTQFYVMQAVHELYPSKDPFAMNQGRLRMLDIVCGSDHLRKDFSKRFLVEDILPWWTKDDEAFRTLSKKYYLYK